LTPEGGLGVSNQKRPERVTSVDKDSMIACRKTTDLQWAKKVGLTPKEKKSRARVQKKGFPVWVLNFRKKKENGGTVSSLAGAKDLAGRSKPHRGGAKVDDQNNKTKGRKRKGLR